MSDAIPLPRSGSSWELRMATAILFATRERGESAGELLELIDPPARERISHYLRELALLPRGWAAELCSEVLR